MAPDPETQPLLATSTNDSTTAPGDSLDKAAATATTDPDSITWLSETRLLARYTIPMIGTYLLQYFYNLMIVLVCSRLSTDELAAVSLGITTSNIVGFAVFEGMATGLDTLCAQAFGAGNLQMVGTHTLRFTIMVHLVAIPIGALWLTSPWTLPYLVPSEALARDCGMYLQWSLIGVPGYAAFEAGKRFMQAQGNFNAGLMVLVVCLPLNIFLNWLLVFHLDLRIAGAALAAAITNAVRPAMLVFYARYISPESLQCWPKSVKFKQLCENWGPLVRFGIPGVVMTLAEWMAFEIVTFATSYVSNPALAAQTFLTQAVNIVWHFAFSASVVASTRIGQLVGGGHLEAAKKVSRFSMFNATFIAVFDLSVFVGLLEIVIHYLALEDVVSKNIASAMPIACVFVLLDCMVTSVHGVVRGIGWQFIGGWVAVLVNYLCGLPIALVLELGPPKMGLRGIWIGETSGFVLIFLIEGLIVKMRSWDRVIEEARLRQQT